MSNIIEQKGSCKERIMQGFLDKKSRNFFGSWQSRYFVAFNNKIAYFYDSDEKDKRGQIDIFRIAEIVCIKDLQLQLIVPQRKYELQAKTKQMRDEWVQKLNKLRRPKKNQSPESKQTKSTDRIRHKQKRIVKKNSNFRDYCQHMQSILTMTQISNLLKQYQREEIQSRMISLKSQSGLYWAISCKPLQVLTNDDKIFDRQLIKPYDYNTLYVIRDQKILQYCRCANIINVSPQPSEIYIQFQSDKLLKMSIETEDIEMIKVIKFNKLLKRMIEIGKQYHNPMDITLNKNIDFMLKIYEENKKASSNHIIKEFKNLMKQNYSESRKQIDNVFVRMQALNTYLTDIYNACRVKHPSAKDFFKFVCKIQQPHVYEFFQQSWNNNYNVFSIEDIGRFSSYIANYHNIVKSIIDQPRLNQGVKTLFAIFLRKKQEKMYEILCNHGQKYQQTDINTIPRNGSNIIIFQRLIELIDQLKNRTENQENFIQICTFLKNFFKSYCQIKLKNLSQVNDLQILLANCNDIDCFTTEDLPKIQKKMINNIYSSTVYRKLCGHDIETAIFQLKQKFIQKIFLAIFSSINKKLLAKNLGEIDLGQISAVIEVRLSEIEDQVTEKIRQNIQQKTLDQVCYFYYNCIVKFPNTGNFSAAEIAKKIDNDVKRIQTTFIKILPKDKVLFQVQDLLNLSTFIVCKQQDAMMNLKDIRDNFGASFNQSSLKCLINLRDGSWESKKNLLEQCIQCLKSTSGYSPEEIIDYNPRQSFMDNWRHTRSRKSTLTVSTVNKKGMDLQLTEIKKKFTSGYLKKKKVLKTIPSLYYDCFLILKSGKLYQYDREDSDQPNSIINISQLNKCYLLPEDEKTIFMESHEGSYQFKALNVEESHHWLRKILEQKSNQIGNSNKNENQVLFRDYFDSQPSSFKKLSYIDKKKSERQKKKEDSGCSKCSFGLLF